MGNNEILCDCDIIHKDLVEKAKANSTNLDVLGNMLKTYKALADSTRLKIIDVLRNNGLCVCDICSLLNMTKSAVSHQLKYLKQISLVKSKRSGKEIWYSLDDEHVLLLFDICIKHVMEEDCV